MYKNICHSCGHIDTAYSHRLNLPLLTALKKLVEFHRKFNRTLLAEEFEQLGLTYNQISNFQKLKYFDLVRNYDSKWFPTAKGMMFVDGTLAIPSGVVTFKGYKVEKEHPAYRRDFPIVYFSEITEKLYKRKEEYAAEKAS